MKYWEEEWRGLREAISLLTLNVQTKERRGGEGLAYANTHNTAGQVYLLMVRRGLCTLTLASSASTASISRQCEQ